MERKSGILGRKGMDRWDGRELQKREGRKLIEQKKGINREKGNRQEKVGKENL